jgi:hypothetical protein
MTADCSHGRPIGLDGRGAGCRHCTREAGRAARDRGLASAVDSSGGDWDLRAALNCIRTLASSGRDFGADDLRELLPAVGSQTIGAAFNVAARRKIIRCVGYWQSTTASRRAGLIRVWRGTEQARRPA